MPFPLNLYLIGAQKAGTTFLSTLLGQHPDICLSAPKEPDFFTKHWDKGADWYRHCFSNPDMHVLLDASVSYSAAPLECEREKEVEVPSKMDGVPERIRGFSPNAKFIYLMRDPVARTYSAYWHAVRAGEEQRGFSEVIRSDAYALRMGCYYYQLSQYFKFFERNRFLILMFEDFVRSPTKTANHCFQWLGLSSLPNIQLGEGKNSSYVSGPALTRASQYLARFRGVKPMMKLAKRLIPKSVQPFIRNTLTRPVPPMETLDRDWLTSFFSQHNRLLESELHLDLTNWARSRHD